MAAAPTYTTSKYASHGQLLAVSFHWFRSRWRTRREYTGAFLQWLRRFGLANGLVIVVILLAILVYYNRTGPGLTPAVNRAPAYDLIATSPDSQFTALVGPPPHTNDTESTMRQITVRTVGSATDPSRIVTSFLVPGFGLAYWSPDGLYLAVITGRAGESPVGGAVTFVLSVGQDGARRLNLPEESSPQTLLAGIEPLAIIQTADLRFKGWRGDTLRVTSTGHGWLGSPAEPESSQVGIRCQIDFEVSAHSIRMLDRDC